VSSSYVRWLLCTLVAAASGCARAPVKSPPERTEGPALQAHPTAATPTTAVTTAHAPSARWFVPYFAPLTVSDAWSPDGALTLAHTQEGEQFLFQARRAAPIALLAFPAAVWAGVWSHDGRYIAGLSRQRLVVIDSETRATVADVAAPLDGRDSGTQLLGFMPDGRRVVICGSNGQVQLVDTRDGQLTTLDDLKAYGSPRLAPGRAWLAYATRAGGLAIYDLERRQQIFSDPRSLTPAVWFSAGDRLVATARDYSVVIAPGHDTVELAQSAPPTWNDRGTLLAFDERAPCRNCLRPFGRVASSICALAKRPRATTSCPTVRGSAPRRAACKIA